MRTSFAKDMLFGLAVGDALGVPVEFVSRGELDRNPVKDMIGYGTHYQPPGTWSDDASLAFCLAESLCGGYDLHDIGRRFIRWREQDYWTARGEVFDIGVGTSHAIDRLKRGISPALSGGDGEYDNGNGSLMRILPVLAQTRITPSEEAVRIISDVSSITHRHMRSVLACVILVTYARMLLAESSRFMAFNLLQGAITNLFHEFPAFRKEIRHFGRLIFDPVTQSEAYRDPVKAVRDIDRSDIQSSGYVVDTLEASFWCLLTTDSYAEAVLKAVNLGGDADTTAAVTGGLAGICYGYDAIPQKWIKAMARKDDIMDLAGRLDTYHLQQVFRHRCPACNKPLIESVRYPRYVCRDCVEEAADSNGRRLVFHNTHIFGGFEARYADTGEACRGNECFIRGLKCRAGEHHFGGIVVEVITDE